MLDFAQLDFRKLRIFYLVARHGGLRAAASKLNMTLSGASFSIRKLEDQLGVPLFKRTPNRLILTLEGSQLAETVESIFTGIDKILAGSTFEGERVGHLSMSINSDLAWYFGPKISSFVKKYPDIELSLSIKNSIDALRSVENGDIDIAIGRFGTVPGSLEIAPIIETSMSLMCRKDHQLARRKTIRLIDMAKYRLIAAGPWTQQIINMAFSNARLPTVGQIEVGNCQTASELVASGVGIGLIHSFCIQRAKSNVLHFRDISRHAGRRIFSAVYRKKSNAQPALLKYLRDALLDREI